VTYELALISVVIAAGYWGLFFVRQRPHGSATFGAMQLAAAGLSGLGLLGRSYDAAWLGVAGAIGVGAGACLLVLGPLARALARRLIAAERVGAALRLLDIAELLAPGSGVTEDKAVIRAMAEIREGRIDHTVDALTAAKQRAPAEAQLAIDERIAMLYLAAYRWGDAVQYAESHLFGSAALDDGDGSLRRALGVAPPVWVELLGAYGRIGDLEQSAKMLARLEDVCAGRDDAALWIHRARVMFLALAGRIEAVRALLAPRQARHMTRATRAYWLGVAHEHGGDRAAAARAYQRARARSRGRPRELIDRALAGLADRSAPVAPGAAAGAELAANARAVVARVESAPLPPPIRLARPRGPRATWLITAMLFAVAASTTLAIGDTSDVGVLVRAGGLVHGMVASGEWWRVIASVMLHVGFLHLVLNAMGMIVLGRLAEDLFGSVRMIAIFAAAGGAGAAVSYLASPAGISAGASGAVFGLLGAVFVELTWYRQRYRLAWKRGMWGGLAVVTIGQLGYGLFYPVVDQWAHVAGLVAGGLVWPVVSPNARWPVIGGYVAGAIALAFGAALAVAAVEVVRTPIAASLAGGGSVRRAVDGVAITAPRGWLVEARPSPAASAPPAQIYQPDGIAVIALARQPAVDPDRQLAGWVAEQRRRSQDEIGELATAPESMIALPAGWQGVELEAAHDDDMGYRQRFRVVVCGRRFGDAMIFTAVQVPETIAREAPGWFAQLLASIGPA
jgi:rhomboid protease GluP